MFRTLSLSTSSVNPLNAEAAFKAAATTGYKGIELMVSPNKSTQDAGHIQELIEKYSMPVTSVHAPTLLLCKFVWGTEPGNKLTRSVKFAEQLGATSVVVHPPFKNNPYSKKFLQHVKNLQEDTNVHIAVENMFPWGARGHNREIYGPSWEETCDIAEYLTFDFSHAALSGMNVLEFFKNYHEKTRIIHLADGSTRNQTKGDSIKDEHMLPGEGDMPIQEVYEFLNRNNWKGETVLELNTRKHRNLEGKMPMLQQSIDYYNNVANPVLKSLIQPAQACTDGYCPIS